MESIGTGIKSGYQIYQELKEQYAKFNEIADVLDLIEKEKGKYSSSYKAMEKVYKDENKRLEEMKKAEYNF